jgi:hypothetical protein
MSLAVEPDAVEPEHTFIGNGVMELPVRLNHAPQNDPGRGHA